MMLRDTDWIISRMLQAALLSSCLFFFSACGQKTEPQAMAAKWQGKPVVVNYWATWCTPCREEIPELNALHKQSEGRWLVFGVNFDDLQGDDLLQAVDELGVRFPLLHRKDIEYLALESPKGLPATYIIGADGLIKASLFGPQTEATLLPYLQ